MKKFETPIVEIEKFEMADVITTSAVMCDSDGCGSKTPTQWD